MEDPRTGVISTESNSDEVPFCCSDANNISLRRVEEIEFSRIGTSDNAECVLPLL
jgi:hypothetical protein